MNHLSLKIVHVKWIKICYDVFYSDLDAFDLRPAGLSVNAFLALMVIASMAKCLELDTSVVCNVLEPFVTESETLWFALDARIGIKSPFEPSFEGDYGIAERFYHDTLASRSDGHNVICLDVQKLKSSNGSILARFNLDNFDTFGRFKLNAAKCHTHFALACLAYLSRAASRNGTARIHVCEYVDLVVHHC